MYHHNLDFFLISTHIRPKYHLGRTKSHTWPKNTAIIKLCINSSKPWVIFRYSSQLLSLPTNTIHLKLPISHRQNNPTTQPPTALFILHPPTLFKYQNPIPFNPIAWPQFSLAPWKTPGSLYSLLQISTYIRPCQSSRHLIVIPNHTTFKSLSLNTEASHLYINMYNFYYFLPVRNYIYDNFNFTRYFRPLQSHTWVYLSKSLVNQLTCGIPDPEIEHYLIQC